MPPRNRGIAGTGGFCVTPPMSIQRVAEGADAPAGSLHGTLRPFVRDHPEAALVAMALLVGAFTAAWQLLQDPNFFSGYDYARMHFFYKSYFRQALLSGRLPMWNPYAGLGRPFLSDIETQTLYPPNLLVLPLGVAGGVALSVLLHQALAVYGGAKLGLKLGAARLPSIALGAGFALASPFTARLAAGMVPVYCDLCWWPALLWLAASLQDGASRGKALGFAAAVALAILAGNPPILFVEMLGLSVFILARATLPRDREGRRRAAVNLACLGASALLGAGLAAVQLMPFLELLGQGNRPFHDASFATANGMPPASWLSLIFPASESFAPNWENDLYVGLVPLLAAPGAMLLWRDRNVRGLLAMGFAGGLLAAGDRAPFLGWLVRLVPAAAALRLPARYGICVSAALLGLAAVAVSRRRPVNAGLALAAAAVAAFWIAWLRPYVAHASAAPVPYFAVHAGAIAACAGLLVAWNLGLRAPRAALALTALLPAAALADWLSAVRQLSPVYSAYGYPRNLERTVGGQLRAAGLEGPGQPPPRLSLDSALVAENAGMAGGFSTYSSYSNPALGRVWHYLHLAAGAEPSRTDYIRLPRSVTDGADRLHGLSLVGSLDAGSGGAVLHAPSDPRAFLSHRTEAVPDWRAAEALEAAGRGSPDVALVETGEAPPVPLSGRAGAEACSITSFAPERVEVRADAESPGILVLCEAWYPGWGATVNGSPARVIPVNGWMRGVAVPGGSLDVVFAYGPGAAGAWVSLAAAALLGLLAWRLPPAGAPLGIALAGKRPAT
jgi:hypothetical protein